MPRVALCYIRQSFTRDENDKDSPERQRANIERICEDNEWTPEWYEDAEGHKSGRTVKNRPGWLALEKRLGDDDVVALVGNDLARLHRKGWRVGDLIDRLEKHDISLVLAAPNRQVDTSTPMGRIFIQFHNACCFPRSLVKYFPSLLKFEQSRRVNLAKFALGRP